MSRALSIGAKAVAEMQEAWEWYYQKSVHTSENFKMRFTGHPDTTNVNR